MPNDAEDTISEPERSVISLQQIDDRVGNDSSDSDDGIDSEEEDDEVLDDDWVLETNCKKIHLTTPRVLGVLERAGITNRTASMLFEALIKDNHTRSNQLNDYAIDFQTIRRARIRFRSEKAVQVCINLCFSFWYLFSHFCNFTPFIVLLTLVNCKRKTTRTIPFSDQISK